jgi:hypothetical protein
MRLNVKALMSTHLRPYAFARDWKKELLIVAENRATFGKNHAGELYILQEDYDNDHRIDALVLAHDICEALPAVEAIRQAHNAIVAALRAPFDEPSVRLLVGVMLDVFPGKPGESAAVYVDALVWSLEEFEPQGEGLAVPTAAIAAAIAEAWKATTFKPSISEFLGLVQRHWARLSDQCRSIEAMGSFVATLEKLAPPTRPEVEPHIIRGGDDDLPF